jgi:hypothetical protein
MKYRIDSEYAQADGKFAFIVTPDQGASVSAYRSEAVYASNFDAMIAGVQYLENKGVRNINWHAVATVAAGLG